MTQLEKIHEIIREYENGSDISAEDVLRGIQNVLDNTRDYRQEVRIETPAGTLCAYVGPDTDNPNVGLYLIPDGSNDEIDIAIAECKGEELLEEGENPKNISVYTYSDVTTDEWHDKFVLAREDVASALGIEEKPEKKRDAEMER